MGTTMASVTTRLQESKYHFSGGKGAASLTGSVMVSALELGNS